MKVQQETVDIKYDGLYLSVTIEFDDGREYLSEIAATSDGTDVTSIFTDCVQSLIKTLAIEAIKKRNE